MTSYNLFAQATPTGLTSGAGNNGTNGIHFTVKGLCTLAGVWHYSSASDTQLPTSIGVYTTQANPASGTLVTSNTATWLTAPGGGSASAGSGWCFAAFTSPPSLTPGVDYMATQFRNDSVNRWFSFYTVTWPVNVTMLTAPMDKSTSALSQGWYNIGTSMAFPLTQTSTAGSNFGMDVQVTTTPPVAIFDQPATGRADASVSSAVYTWPVNPTAGSTVLIALSATDFGVSSAVDNGTSPTTFSIDLALAPGAISGKYILRGNNITLPASGNYHVTVTFGGTNNFTSGEGASFLGLASGAASATNTNTATSTSASTGNVTPPATGSLLYGGVTTASSLNPETITLTTAGAATVYTNTNGASFLAGSWAYKPVTTTTAQGLAWTLGDSVSWGGYVAVYALSGTTHSGATALTGSGTFTAAGVFAGAASLSGSGTITATGQKKVPGAAALTGSGTITASGVFAGAASLSGSGTFTATGQKQVPGATAMSGSGTLAAAGHFAGAASLSGSGTFTATGQKQVPGAAALTGSGTFTAAGHFAGAAALSGSGTFTGTAQKQVPGAAAMSGSGALTAAGVFAGAASLSGSGTFTATGQKQAPGAASLSGSGTFTATGQKTVPGVLAASGSGTLTAAGQKQVPAAAALSGSGTFAATGQKSVPGAAAMSGTGSMTAREGNLKPGAASLTGSGTFTGTGQKQVPGATAMSGSGTLAAGPLVTYNRAASLSGSGTFTATGQKSVPGAAPLSGSGAFTATGQKSVPGSAPLSGSGSLTAAGSFFFSGAAALSGSGTLTPDGQKQVPAAASLTGSGTFTANGVPVRFGTSAFYSAVVLTVTATAGPDLEALWAAYQQARLFAEAQASGYRMTRVAAVTDGTAGFLYGSVYEAERAADAAYEAFQAAQRRVRAGVTG